MVQASHVSVIVGKVLWWCQAMAARYVNLLARYCPSSYIRQWRFLGVNSMWMVRICIIYTIRGQRFTLKSWVRKPDTDQGTPDSKSKIFWKWCSILDLEIHLMLMVGLFISYYQTPPFWKFWFLVHITPAYRNICCTTANHGWDPPLYGALWECSRVIWSHGDALEHSGVLGSHPGFVDNSQLKAPQHLIYFTKYRLAQSPTV